MQKIEVVDAFGNISNKGITKHVKLSNIQTKTIGYITNNTSDIGHFIGYCNHLPVDSVNNATHLRKTGNMPNLNHWRTNISIHDIEDKKYAEDRLFEFNTTK